MDPILAFLAMSAGHLGHSALTVNDLSQKKPTKDSANASAAKYEDTRQKIINDRMTPNDLRYPLGYSPNTPEAGDKLYHNMQKALDYGSHVRAYPLKSDGSPDRSTNPRYARININPNTHAEILAHEIGHDLSSRTRLGKVVRDMRDSGPMPNNRKLQLALATAAGLSPLVNSSLQEGDDDLAIGLALATAGAAPSLVDEALATKEGLNLMKQAGKPADLGQRGRLAGAYLTYLAKPILAATGGWALGSAIDDYTAVYDI